MSQQILFKRGLTLYSSVSAVKAAFDALTWTAGEPVVASYIDNSVTKILFAIGISDGVGSTHYRLISDNETVNQLATSLGQAIQTLNSHIDQLADGENSGHVVNSEEADIVFENGVGKIKAGKINLDSISTSDKSGILGYKTSDLSTTNNNAPAVVLTWDEIINELSNADLKTFRKATIGGETVESQTIQGELKITLDDNFKVTKDSASNSLHISLNGTVSDGEEGAPVTLTTASGPVKISGTSNAIVTEFGSDVAFPNTPAIQNETVTVGSAGDVETSKAVPTVGYVIKKINSVLASNDAMHYMGTLDPSVAEFKLPAGNAGDTYKITAAGTITGLGEVHVGDMIICKTDNTAENTAANWDVIEVHDGSISAPTTATNGNIAVFDANGSALADGGVKVSDLVKGSVSVGANNGLELTGSNTTGALGNGNVVISHSEVSLTEEGKDTGTVVTGVETNKYGHVTKVTYGEAAKNLELEHTGEGWVGNTLNGGYFINGVQLENNTLSVFATGLPGTVRAASGTELKFLKDAIVGKTESLGANEYAITSAQKGSTVELSVVIDKIDGGTF